MKMFGKIKSWFDSHKPTKRRIIQLYAALLFNANIKGYITGDIFKGTTKNFCTPGLNCYSCPGAVGACPMGALQNALYSANKNTLYYMAGIIILYGLILGRWICGWLCPFGLVQDLLHKIKVPKLKKNRFTRVLSHFKYVVLVFFGIILPLMYAMRDFPLPGFCKYICPAGTLGGAIGLLISPENAGMFGMLGPLFTWKFALLVSFVVLAIFVYRVFCRFVCPLGALYSLFNKFCLLGIKLEKSKCIDCGICISTCKMDIKHVGDRECIHCGDCIPYCPTKAISWKGSKIILPDDEIEEAKTDEDLKALEKRRSARVTVLNRLVAAVLAITLIGSVVYFNFVHKEPEVEICNIGDKCYALDLETVDGSGNINVDFYQGKVIVINFWGTWCAPCVAELPHFDEVAEKYAEDAVVIAVHTVDQRDSARQYVGENYPDSHIKFVFDQTLEGSSSDKYYSILGGKGSYPMTVIVDKKGIVQYVNEGSMTFDELDMYVEYFINE